MKKAPKISPPRWATKLLAWYCQPALLEDLEGDLNEYFQRNVKMKGARRARVIYVIDVLKFFRLYTVRKPEFLNLLIHWIMIGSYIKTSGRSIVRNKLFSTINITGLAISMSIGLLMVALLSDLLSYDNFHKNGDNIYRVITTRHRPNESPREYASTSVRAGKQITETIPGIENISILEGGLHEDFHRDTIIVPLKGLWADESFFNIFTFSLLKGNPATALKEPYSIVLTESAAKKLFSQDEAFGKSVTINNADYQVTGIVEDPPRFSHLRFEVLASLSSKEILEKENPEWSSWSRISSNYVYLVLPENRSLQSMEAALNVLSQKENINPDVPKITLALQPLNDIALGKGLSNGIGPSIPDAIIWVLGGLASIVILCACFNYTSLSIARTLKRAREIGIRKVVGARKANIFGQLIIEAVVISLLSLIVSFLLFLFIRPHFLSLDPLLNSMVTLRLSPNLILYFAALAVAVGILAGFLPALFFSKINTVQILKKLFSVKGFHHINLRKSLIVLQYTFSLLFISVTILGYKQYRHFVAFDLGFNTENILNIDLQGNKSDLLIKGLLEIPGITAVSRSGSISSVGSYARTPVKYGDPPDSTNVYYNSIDENYLTIHDFALVAGKNFQPNQSSENHIIVNEQFLRYFNLDPANPFKYIGTVASLNGKDLEIIGVVRDFYYGGAYRVIEPFVFRYSITDTRFVNARISSPDPFSVRAQAEVAWRRIDPVHSLDAVFYDDQIVDAHSDVAVLVKVIGFLSFLAISIASLGLFGMVVFTTETRLREISIRKVFGSTEGNLIYVLSKGFLYLLTVSLMISLPVAYLLFDKIILPNIAYPAPLGTWELLFGAMIVTGIAILTIGSQTLKAARSNPAEVLKNE